MTKQDQLTYVSPLCWGLAFITAMMWAPAYEAELFGAAFALLVVSAVCADGIGIYKAYWTFPGGPVIYIGLGFWIVALLSIVFSDVAYVAYVFFFQFSLLPVAFLSFVLGHNTRQRLTIAGWGLCATTAGLGVLAIVQYLALPGWLQNGKLVAYPIKNPNGLAALLMLGAFAGLALACSARARKHVVAAVILAALSGLGIYTTGGRAVFIAMLIGFVLMLALLPRDARRHNLRHISVFAGIMLAGFAVFSILTPAGTNTGSAGPAAEAGKSIDKPSSLLGSRPELWRATWDMIQDYPLTGTGIGTFFLYYPEYRIKGETSAGFMAHSDPLQYWAELGIAGPILFYAFLIAGLVRTLQAGKIGRNSQDPVQRAVYNRMIISLCGLGVLIAHAHVSFPLHISAILLAAGWHLAQWYHASAQLLGQEYACLRLPETLSPRWREPLIGAVFGLGLIAILGALSPIIASEHYIHRAKRAADAGDVKAYAKYVNNADRVSFGLNAKAYQMAATLPVAILESDKPMSSDKVQAMFRRADTLLDKALRYNPRLVRSYSYKARARMAVAERTGNAPDPLPDKLLRRALRLNPKHLPAREALFRYYKSRGKQKRAYSVLKDGMNRSYGRYDLEGYYSVLSRAAMQQGDLVMHAKALKKLYELRKADKKPRKHNNAGRNALQEGWHGLEGPE